MDAPDIENTLARSGGSVILSERISERNWTRVSYKQRLGVVKRSGGEIAAGLDGSYAPPARGQTVRQRGSPPGRLTVEAEGVNGRSAAFLTPVEVYRLWQETDRRIDSLTRSVRECKRVDEASTFSRWLQFSGILEVLERNSCKSVLPVDGRGLRLKVKELVAMCGELYRQGKASARYAESDIAEINRKLDVIAAHVSNL